MQVHTHTCTREHSPLSPGAAHRQVPRAVGGNQWRGLTLPGCPAAGRSVAARRGAGHRPAHPPPAAAYTTPLRLQFMDTLQTLRLPRRGAAASDPGGGATPRGQYWAAPPRPCRAPGA